MVDYRGKIQEVVDGGGWKMRDRKEIEEETKKIDVLEKKLKETDIYKLSSAPVDIKLDLVVELLLDIREQLVKLNIPILTRKVAGV